MEMLHALWLWALALLVHELGHYASARLFGVTVLRVFVFLEYQHLVLFKMRIAGTVFGMGVVPTMGYTLLDGIEPLPLGKVRPGMFHLAPRWKRTIIILSGPAVNLCMALLFRHFDTPEHNTVMYLGMVLNGLLAVCTLLPLPGTDGNHLLRMHRGGSFEHL